MWPFNSKKKNVIQTDTAQTAFLRREYSAHPSRGLTPPILARLLESAEQGDMTAQAQLAEDMEEKDAHLFAELSKRKRAILALNWDISAPGIGKRNTKRITELFEEIPDFEDLLLDMMDGLLKGYSCLELEWKNTGGLWIPTAHYRPADWFVTTPEEKGTLLLRSQNIYHTPRGETINAEPLIPGGWITHIHKSKSGWLPRAGLVRVLAWPYLFKNYSVRDLAELLEIYGIPIGLGQYPHGATAEEKTTLLNALTDIGHNARGIIPEGMAINFLSEAKGNVDPFQFMIEWCDKAISKAIVGGTLSTDSSGGTKTNALGNIHERALWELTISDARQIAGTITRDLLAPIAAFNGLNIGAARFIFDTGETDDINQFSTGLQALVQSGLGPHIPVSWVTERLGIPAPTQGEPVLQAPMPAPAPAPAPELLRAGLKAGPELPPMPVAPDRMRERLGREMAALMPTALGPIEELLEQSNSLEEFRDGLDGLFPGMNREDRIALLEQAIAAAMLAGMWDVENENAD
jgi:phage gp29-like protein